ncbi:transmembrane protein 178A-like [Haliotis rubra]|uniref:transmembrane protein 178A-like n=1 Tax=Haliotis rubra TaxID=36100 RepID=UPI001EE594C1|nr:transmembrane protein 178A-like [Haliotis rubra]
MTNRQFSFLIFVLFLLLAALTLTLIGVLTEYWYYVEADSNLNETMQQHWNYNYGLWKKCYTDIPRDIVKNKVGSCVTIYQDLIKRDESSLDKDGQVYMHLSRSVVGFAIAMGAVQLAAVFTLICGNWPGNCKTIRKGKLYLSASLILLFATMCGIVSGISFIALRDLDRKDRGMYPYGVSSQYGWSFMVTWISAGLNIVDSFILLCLLRTVYDDVNEGKKYYYYNMGN